MKKIYEDILEAFAHFEKIAMATVISANGSTPRAAGAKMLVFPDGHFRETVGGGVFESIVIRDALEVLTTGRAVVKTYSFNPDGQYATGAVCGGKVEVLIEMIANSPHLVVVGGGHVGRALVKAASLLDFNITLVDDRKEFSAVENTDRKIDVILSPPDYSALPEITENTYVCLVTKGYPSDEIALRRVIKSPAKYIGMIGSRKKIQTVYANMEKDGFDKKALERVHAPIGADINADSPEEIAVSILAEIIRIKNQP